MSHKLIIINVNMESLKNKVLKNPVWGRWFALNFKEQGSKQNKNSILEDEYTYPCGYSHSFSPSEWYRLSQSTFQGQSGPCKSQWYQGTPKVTIRHRMLWTICWHVDLHLVTPLFISDNGGVLVFKDDSFFLSHGHWYLKHGGRIWSSETSLS